MILKHLVFIGPSKAIARINFEQGLNVVVGPSNSGKSFIGRAINYMLGGENLNVPPEGAGYEKILLGILFDNKSITLIRSVNGGDIQVVDGLFDRDPGSEEGEILSWKHNKTNSKTISSYFLDNLGIKFGTEVIKDAKNRKASVTIRSLLKWVMPNETKLQEEMSPINSGQNNKKTEESRVFNYLLTGIDDSSFKSALTVNKESQIKGQMELLKKIIEKKNKNHSLEDVSLDELRGQIKRLDESILEKESWLLDHERSYEELILTQDKYLNDDRVLKSHHEDIIATKERFMLLKDYYASDKLRLNSLIEASAIFNSVEEESECHFCGSEAEYHSKTSILHDDVEKVQYAAFAELNKIEQQEQDLQLAIIHLEEKFEITLEKMDEIQNLLNDIRQSISNHIEKMRRARLEYKKFIITRQTVDFTIAQQEEMKELQVDESNLRDKIDIDFGEVKGTPETYFEKLSLEIQERLKSWSVINSERVTFNNMLNDITVDGKNRRENGKGVRALLHAGFSVGLLDYCLKNDKPHPGFLILDSPLVTFDPKKNDGKEELHIDVKDSFFKNLNKEAHMQQVIVLENRDCVPSWVDNLETTTIFTLNKSYDERAGFFPI